MRDRILLASPHMSGGEMKYIQRAFDTNWIAPLGENVNGFENDLAAKLGEGEVVALASGTAALHMAMILAGVGRGDTVFCQDLTFAASVNPAMYMGARPVFIDSERDSWNMDPALLKEAIDKFGIPKAVIAVELYGTPGRMDELEAICREKGIVFIEDAAEAMGASYKGRNCGTFGDFGALSFNGNKIITTSGGGAIVCHSKEDASHALKLATQSREAVPWYEHREIGYNYRLSNISAGIGRGQMEALEERIAQKRHIREVYQRELACAPVSFQPCPQGGQANHWLTSILLEADCAVTPGQVIEKLNQENIETRHIWKPMHLQPVFADAPFVTYGDGDGVSGEVFDRGLCLPSDTKLTEEQLMEVADCVKGAVGV